MLNHLYHELILDHGRHPRNFSLLADYTHHQEGFNPLCGDKVTVYVRLQDERIEQITFQGAGCAISMASASLMTEALRGKTVAEAQQLFHSFHQQVMGKSEPIDLGKLNVFSGVAQFPMRVKCATLSWHTLIAALGAVEA